jgi:hypothetical protein
MKTVFPTQLTVLEANAGSPIDLACIQNEILRQALEDVRYQSSMQAQQLEEQAKQLALLNANFDRRTAQWTPAKASPAKAYSYTQPSQPFGGNIVY